MEEGKSGVSGDDGHDERERKEVDAVAALLEGRSAVGREQRHRERMEHEDGSRRQRGAADAAAEPPEPGQERNGRSASARHSQRAHSVSNSHGRLSSVMRRGSRTPASHPTRPPSTFAAAVAGKRRSGRHEIEGDPGREAPRDRETPQDARRRVERAGQPAERQQQDRLGTGEGGERQARRR